MVYGTVARPSPAARYRPCLEALEDLFGQVDRKGFLSLPGLSVHGTAAASLQAATAELLELKLQAIQAHLSQVGGMVDAFGEDIFRRAMKAGVKIVFGTDIGGIPWTDPIAQEFPRMVDLGMSPMDAIKSATSRPAEMLGMEGQIGVVAPGAYADIIAVNGDPLHDIKVLGSVQFVMKDGKVFKQ